MQEGDKYVVIIGAGPAGLTAAYELLEQTDFIPLVLEQDDTVGGIARTVEYKGYRIDIGGHRFFSKSDKVMDWWLRFLPLQKSEDSDFDITYHNKSKHIHTEKEGPDPEFIDDVMLIRKRKSRIFYLRKFFDYPISLSLDTLQKLGPWRTIKVGLSYLKSAIFPIRNVRNLEDFFINRFGKELYKTFFRDYTEKVWGKPCTEISAEWGEQRIKGLSIISALKHALTSLFGRQKSLAQKDTETSLIEKFLYPKYGPGHLWKVVKQEVEKRGGMVIFNCKVTGILKEGGQVTGVKAVDRLTSEEKIFHGKHVISSMPVKHLIRGLGGEVPEKVTRVSEGLEYRDFITVGLLLRGFREEIGPISDNWIYIQEPDVMVGRLQIFNNWSPYLIVDPDKVWVGMEYFCNTEDDIWQMKDSRLIELAARELSQIGLVDEDSVLDGIVIRMPKTYPAYFGVYKDFPEIIDYLDQFKNLWLVGRNGMHKYNNQDHSMLTAMKAVENIREGTTDKSEIWSINTEQEYLEEKSGDPQS